jgi:uncharacterized protein (TIGR03067 family)
MKIAPLWFALIRLEDGRTEMLKPLAIALMFIGFSWRETGASCGEPKSSARPTPDQVATQNDLAEAEIKKFTGTWKLTELERDGKMVPASELGDTKLVFQNNQYTYKALKGGRDQGSFKVDPARNPRVMETTLVDGPRRGQTSLRIYTWIDGDTLK